MGQVVNLNNPVIIFVAKNNSYHSDILYVVVFFLSYNRHLNAGWIIRTQPIYCDIMLLVHVVPKDQYMNCIFPSAISIKMSNVKKKKVWQLAPGFPISLPGNVIEEIKVALTDKSVSS